MGNVVGDHESTIVYSVEEIAMIFRRAYPGASIGETILTGIALLVVLAVVLANLF